MRNPKLTLGNKKWTFERPRSITLNGDGCDGLCDRETRTIKIKKSLAGLPELDTTLHEVLHAIGDFLDEDFVDNNAKEMAIALWSLGYRRLTVEQIKTLGLA